MEKYWKWVSYRNHTKRLIIAVNIKDQTSLCYLLLWTDTPYPSATHAHDHPHAHFSCVICYIWQSNFI